jgi:hydrogenase-4 component B
MSAMLVLWGIAVSAGSGIPGLLLSRGSMAGQRVSTLLAALGSGLGVAGVVVFWATGQSQPIVLPWHLPGAEFRVAVDALSAIFLLPSFVIALLGSIYGLSYWQQTEHAGSGGKLRLFYGTLTAGMALLAIAGNAILFLFGWEIMALSAFFLVTTEDDKAEVRDAGWVYLVATHMASLCLFALFALLRTVSGSFTLAPLAPASVSFGMATAIFILALVGFGLKAGIMPLHVWLPGAHAMAPSHVSAMMSGVMLKMGIYGLVRVTSLVPHPPVAWGATVLALGVISGVLGVAFAVGQHDLKRLLAYHSIENIGIIAIGLGLALMGRSLGRSDWIILGLAGSLLHVWNHALFKGLLFLSAGSVIHAVHTRALDQLGGLAKQMPWTALGFLVGAVAICGLPPLNGFVSELFIYLGLFHTLGKESPSFAGVAFAAPALALSGALAVACFVKVYGMVFLGTARSEHAQNAHESSLALLAPMGILAGCCLLIGLAPGLVVDMLGRAVLAWDADLRDVTSQIAVLVPLDWIMAMGLGLIGALLVVSVVLRLRVAELPAGSASPVEEGPTWGCGFAAPTVRMQYTSSSFAQMLVGLFGWALRPRIHRPKDLPLFPSKTEFHSTVIDTVLDEAALPAFHGGAWLCSWFRVFQQGSIQTYLLYIFIALIVLLNWR